MGDSPDPGRDRTAVVVAGATLLALWIAYGIALDPKPPGGSCTTGLREGAYGDSLVPAHLGAYLILVGAIAWTRPPGQRERAALAATAAVVLVSLFWPGPIAVVGAVALLASPPAVLWSALSLWLVFRRGRAEYAPRLLWVALVIALPATFAGAYLNGAGLFCF